MPKKARRFIQFGVDGAMRCFTEKFIAEGVVPNLAALAEQGVLAAVPAGKVSGDSSLYYSRQLWARKVSPHLLTSAPGEVQYMLTLSDKVSSYE